MLMTRIQMRIAQNALYKLREQQSLFGAKLQPQEILVV